MMILAQKLDGTEGKVNRMRKLICPHCGKVQETHEPDQISADMCWTQCEKCGKDFWYSVDVTREYDSWIEDEK